MTTAQLLFYFIIYLIFAFIVEKIYRKSVHANPEIDITKYSNQESGVIFSQFRDKKLEDFKRNRFLAHFVFLSFFVYLATNFPGYLYLLVIGLIIIQAVYRSERLHLERRLFIDPRLGGNESVQAAKMDAELRKNRIIAFIVAFAVCLNWYIQIERNASLHRESFLKEIIELKDKNWCQIDEYKFDAYGAMYYAGWPCVEIRKIQNTYFKKDWFTTEACINVHLDQEIGFPGENRYLDFYRYADFCIADEGGFSIEALEEVIREGVAADLKAMQVKRCRDYSGFATSDEHATYCSN